MAEKILKQIYGGGAFAKYRALTVGRAGIGYLSYFEACQIFLRHLSGLPGLVLRRLAYKPLFRRMGRGAIIGTGVTLRNPRQIEIGDRIVLDDGCVLDAKGEASRGITIGSDVFVSRNAVLSLKDGGIAIGSNVTIGPNTIIQSIAEAQVTVGDYAMIAANVYLIGCGDYRHDRTDVPMAEQGLGPGRGIAVGRDVWIGASVVVCDGAVIGESSIVGAQSLVRGEIPPRSVAFGCPAVVKARRDGGHAA
jgi:acetyltransferase-like isoleucine patch superfamily enzyme